HRQDFAPLRVAIYELGCSRHDANSMIVTVPDIHRAAIDEDAVWTVQPARGRISIRPVSALAVADHGRDEARRKVDLAYHVIFGVRDIGRACGAARDSLRARVLRREVERPELGLECGAAVAGIADLAGARDAAHALAGRIDLEDRIALAQHEIHFAVRRDIHRARTRQRAVRQRALFEEGRARFAVAGERRDHSGLGVDAPHA